MLVSGLMASAALAIAIACGGGTPTVPSSGAVATFAIGSETFRMSLTTADQVAAVRAAQSGGRAHIPSGRIVTRHAGQFAVELAS